MDDRYDAIRIGEGVQAEVFLREDGSVLKLWRSSADRDVLQREVRALRVLADHQGVAPALLDVVEVEGRSGLVMERVEGGGLAASLRTRPWSAGKVARALADLHARVHAIQVCDGDLPSLKDDIRQRLEVSARAYPELSRFALSVLESLPDGDRICHGDFHVANVLGDFERLTVIDWPNATRGDPDADVAHTNILHRFGRPREGTSRLDRTAVTLGRRVFAGRYLSAYRSIRPLDEHRFSRWETVRAAARLSTNVPGETESLVRFLERRQVSADRDR